MLGLALALCPSPTPAQELVRFYYNPPDGISFVQRLVISKTRESEGLPPQTEGNEIRTRVTIKKTAGGWEVLNEPLGAVVTRDGKPADNPLIALTQQYPITYRLDALGYLKQIAGYERMMDLMRERFPPDKFEAVSRILNENTLINRDMAEWNGRFGNLVELTATLGRGWAATEQFPLPTGGMVTFYTATMFEDRVIDRGRECVRVAFSFNTEAEDVAKFLGKSVEEMNKTLRGGAAPPKKVSGVEVRGQGERLIEPATMLVHSESMERVITMTTEARGHDPVRTVMTENREYIFEYPDLGKLPPSAPPK